MLMKKNVNNDVKKDSGGGGTPILDLTGILVVTFRGKNSGSGNF